MSEWLPYLLGSVGLTIVIVLSHIARPIRYWGCKLLRLLGLRLPCPLYCSMCTGVWIGTAVASLHLVSSHGLVVVTAAPIRFCIDVLAMGFGTSVVSYLVTTWLESHGQYTKPEHDKVYHDERY